MACSPLSADVAVDVAVVGAGVSGALVVDALLRSGKSVVVLDRRGPVRGSPPAVRTSRSPRPMDMRSAPSMQCSPPVTNR